MKKYSNLLKKIRIGFVFSIIILIIIYLGMVSYFKNHFYFKTTINNINVSTKTVEQVENELIEESKIQNYGLEIVSIESTKDLIKADEIDLNLDLKEEIKKIKQSQNPFYWIFGALSENQGNLKINIHYNENLLKNKIDNLSCIINNDKIKSKNPSFVYNNKNYEVVKEVYGNKINKDTLKNEIVNAIIKGKNNLDLVSMNFYEKPKYTLASKEVVSAYEKLNKYVSSNITYTFGDRFENLNAETLNTWIDVDENYEVILDNNQVKKYVDNLSNKYDTLGKPRDFQTSNGDVVKVSGGYYGWEIDRTDEVDRLAANIQNGEKIIKEPLYNVVAISRNVNDIGNTYVEIDLSKQYLWFYKNGNLIVNGSVVTGNVSTSHSTPEGTYRLNYKEKNATLKGTDYSAPVSYWMPFNGGIGLHDANWRTEFGGSIYKVDGSHGCVNAPYNVAEAVFNNIQNGTPIICHY